MMGEIRSERTSKPACKVSRCLRPFGRDDVPIALAGEETSGESDLTLRLFNNVGGVTISTFELVASNGPPLLPRLSLEHAFTLCERRIAAARHKRCTCVNWVASLGG